MRLRLRTLTLVLLTVGAPAGAVGKSTVDPNTAGATARSLADCRSDARLAQKVTYEARQKTISAILVDLSKATGVTLRAGYNEQDWQVRDRKMNIFVRDLPLASLMSSIARVMKFKWSTSKDAPRTYRLYMDRRTLLDADGRRARRIQKNIEWQTKARECWIRDLANVGKLPDADYERLRETNPYLYLYRKTGMSDALNALFRAAPDLRNAFAAGQEMTLLVSDLTADAQQAVLQLRNANRKGRAIRAGKGMMPSPEAVPDLGNTTLLINEGIDRVAREGANSMYTGWITIRYGERFSDKDLTTPFPNPDFEATRLFGSDWVRCLEEGKPIDQIAHPRSEIDAAQVRDRVRFGNDDDTAEKPQTHSDDSSLQEKVNCKPQDSRLASVLSEFARSTELCVVSDSFGRPHARPASIQGEMKARDLLAKIEIIYNENWEKRGSLLEFRNKDWFMLRSAQLPEASLEKWRQEARKTATLDLDVLWQVDELSYDQKLVNILEDDVLGRISLAANPSLIKIYDCLETSQRRAVTSTSGTRIQLTDAQIATLADLLKATGSPPSRATLTTTRRPFKKQFEYEMRLSGSNDVQLGLWKQTTPEYTKPE